MIQGSRRSLTSAERAQGLTGAKTSAAEFLPQRMGDYRVRRRAAELGQQWRRGGATKAAALANGGGRRERSGGDRMVPRGAGCRLDRDKPVGRGASTTPTYGRHVADVGWTKAGVRTREREGGKAGPRCLARPKGRRVRPATPAPSSIFFEFLFSKKVK